MTFVLRTFQVLINESFTKCHLGSLSFSSSEICRDVDLFQLFLELIQRARYLLFSTLLFSLRELDFALPFLGRRLSGLIRRNLMVAFRVFNWRSCSRLRASWIEISLSVSFLESWRQRKISLMAHHHSKQTRSIVRTWSEFHRQDENTSSKILKEFPSQIKSNEQSCLALHH
jgi:hypothetical protein